MGRVFRPGGAQTIEHFEYHGSHSKGPFRYLRFFETQRCHRDIVLPQRLRNDILVTDIVGVQIEC
jgi:hypothetical protein